MPTVFENISDGFYTAFFEPDSEKRKDKIEAWIKESTPVIQSAVENDLRAYIDEILKDTWTEKGWKSRSEKFYGRSVSIGKKGQLPFIDAYRLCLDLKIALSPSKEKDIIMEPLSTKVREKTNKAIEIAKTAVAKLEPPSPVALREINLHGMTRKEEEAISIVEKFLTECYRENVRRIRVVHGKGIFVLQKAIREYLKTHHFIKSESISSADKDHGGDGATEANLVDFSVDKLN